jgi:hypothetical protein
MVLAMADVSWLLWSAFSCSQLSSLKPKLRRPGGALMPRPTALTYASLSVQSWRKRVARLASSEQAASSAHHSQGQHQHVTSFCVSCISGSHASSQHALRRSGLRPAMCAARTLKGGDLGWREAAACQAHRVALRAPAGALDIQPQQSVYCGCRRSECKRSCARRLQ